MTEEQSKLYICSYGQSSIYLCPLVGKDCDKHNCDLRPVIDYDIYQAKEKECKIQKQRLNEIEEYCKKQNLKYDATACYILGIIHEVKGVL